MSGLVRSLIGVGILLTGGGVAMVISAGGSGEGLSVGFILGIFAIFVVYAAGLLRWKRGWAPPDYRDVTAVDTLQGWELLEKKLEKAQSPLLLPLRAYGRTLLRQGDRLLRTQDALSTLSPASPYIPPESRLPGWLGTGQAVLVTLGLMGTFLGLTLGLFEAMPMLSGLHPNPDEAMTLLLGGARLAFSKSVAGMYWSVVWLFFFRDAEQDYEEVFQDLATLVDQEVPRATVERLLLTNQEQVAAMDRSLQSLAQRMDRLSGHAPAAPVAPTTGGLDLTPLLDALGRLERALNKPADRSLDRVLEQLSEAVTRMGETRTQIAGEASARMEARQQVVNTTLQQSAADVSHVVKELREAGVELSRNLQDANRAAASATQPLHHAAEALTQVHYALVAEREAFENLRRLLTTQTEDIRGHLGEVDQRMQGLQNSYQGFHAQSLTNMDAWQKQMLEFLPEMEKRLHFPGYVKELERALAMEAESRQDLVAVLKKLHGAH